MVKAASLPGSGGIPLQTPQMANLVGTKSVSTAPPEGAMAGVHRNRRGRPDGRGRRHGRHGADDGSAR